MAPVSCFECTRCGHHVAGDSFPTVCPKDSGVLYARYDLDSIRKSSSRDSLAAQPRTMWRYAAVLPDVEPVTLGEGFTPMFPSRQHPNVLIKDEGVNPTGSFKARGLCVTVSMAKKHGLKKLAIPSAGNAGGALAAYAAAARLEANIFMPKDVPIANEIECRAYEANVTLVDGLISDCGRMIGERKEKEGWFEIATLKEPFRVEGKKTMGYEIAEQMDWSLPDAIFYPCGGGVGFLGMWKAFAEMEQLGWLASGSKRPKMVAVQSTGCAPIVKAFEEGKSASEMWPNAQTLSAGLRVPKAYGDYLVLDIIRQSGGTAIAVTDAETIDALQRWAAAEAFFASPEGATTFVAYEKLLASGFLKPADKVVLFNTGSALKYIDVIAEALGRTRTPQTKLPASRNIGGIIGPY
ncbi:MAG: threonine synthase [Acidobacteriales bacterium]|nr:threonine synthase [Terriglobales bacterium]